MTPILKGTLQAVLFAALAGTVYYLLSPQRDSDRILQSGIDRLESVHWGRHDQTLVLAVRPGCMWCSASAPFYASLATARRARRFEIVAMSSHSQQETRSYLAGLNVDVDAVHQVDFAALGVDATPTLILVDSRGTVRASWVGKLSPSQEETVRQRLGVPAAEATRQ